MFKMYLIKYSIVKFENLSQEIVQAMTLMFAISCFKVIQSLSLIFSYTYLNIFC